MGFQRPIPSSQVTTTSLRILDQISATQQGNLGSPALSLAEITRIQEPLQELLSG